MVSSPFFFSLWEGARELTRLLLPLAHLAAGTERDALQGAFEQIFGANQQVSHLGGSYKEAETAARAPFGALVKLANDKTGYRVSAAGLQAGWQRKGIGSTGPIGTATTATTVRRHIFDLEQRLLLGAGMASHMKRLAVSRRDRAVRWIQLPSA
jgi:hypothetical protein